jgi:hypothetical protein
MRSKPLENRRPLTVQSQSPAVSSVRRSGEVFSCAAPEVFVAATPMGTRCAQLVV